MILLNITATSLKSKTLYHQVSVSICNLTFFIVSIHPHTVWISFIISCWAKSIQSNGISIHSSSAPPSLLPNTLLVGIDWLWMTSLVLIFPPPAICILSSKMLTGFAPGEDHFFFPNPPIDTLLLSWLVCCVPLEGLLDMWMTCLCCFSKRDETYCSN